MLTELIALHQRNIEFAKSGLRECRNCGRVRNADFFTSVKSSRDGKSIVCNECQSQKRQTRLSKLDVVVQFHQNINFEKAKRHPKKTMAKSDLKELIRNSARSLLYQNTEKANQMLGCSSKEFRFYLKKYFQKGMTWENYGTVWHIDHCIPLEAFDLDNPLQFKAAAHYSNCQPLFQYDNIQKSDFLPNGRRARFVERDESSSRPLDLRLDLLTRDELRQYLAD